MPDRAAFSGTEQCVSTSCSHHLLGGCFFLKALQDIAENRNTQPLFLKLSSTELLTAFVFCKVIESCSKCAS